VGFVSSHLYAHSVARFFGSLVTGLDRARFETFAWHTGEHADGTSASIAAAVDHFHHRFSPPLEVARAIRAAQLDALVLLDVGMDPATQVLGSLRLAPVQCAAYGHPVTTGLAHVDYFLSGELLDSAEAQRDYSEALVRLPGIGATPQHPPDGSDGGWLHAIADDLPWLLCLQNPLKLTPDFDDVLVEILACHRVRIGVFAVSPPIAARWRERIGARLEARGGDAIDRLHLLPPVSHADLVAGIACATLVLDTPHFSGGSTSLDAIAAATPVVAFKGNRLRANQTTAMLQLAGAAELIAADADDYLGIVGRLLADPIERGRLSDALRAGGVAIFNGTSATDGFQDFLSSVVPDR
jgi:predicted O-linked N-acetylglucosamine transferase (SPINDLY family)